MTNYERICADKAFLALLLTFGDEEEFNEWMKWLDTEQREVNDERTQAVNHE